jgi:hypothetical protein
VSNRLGSRTEEEEDLVGRSGVAAPVFIPPDFFSSPAF